jgi:hypothetical protein
MATIPLLGAQQDPFPGATLAGDFTKGKYKGFGVITNNFTSLPNLTVTRASVGTAEAVDGTVVTFQSGQPRITNRGLLVEESRTNSIRNSMMTGASVGTTPPTNWQFNNGAITGTGWNTVATGTEYGMPYVDLNFTGTNNSGSTIFPEVRFEQNANIAALTGQSWSQSVYCKLISSVTAPATIVAQITEQTSGGVFIRPAVVNVTPTTSLQRVLNPQVLSGGATTAFIVPGIVFGINNTASVNYTIRVYGPQLEAGAFCTSFIPSTSATVTRAADFIDIANAYPSSGTAYAQLIMPANTQSANSRILGGSTAEPSASLLIGNTSGSNWSLQTYNGSVLLNSGNTITLPSNAGVPIRGASTWNSSGRSVTFNGITTTTDVNTWTVPASMRLGADGFSTSQALDGYIQVFAIYPTVLGTSQLQSLTSGVDTSSLSFNFASNSYKINGTTTTNFTSISGVTVTRASTGYAQDSAGNLISFGTNVPRITDQGLLVEESRTNLATQSSSLSNCGTIYGSVTTVTGQTDPAGGTTAVKLIGGPGTWSWGQTVVGLTTSSTYAGSWFVKSDSSTSMNLELYDGTTVTDKAYIIGTSWTRISNAVAIAGTLLRIGVQANSTATIYVAFIQCELGSFATSYIPTTSSTVTRAADVISIGSLSIAQPFTFAVNGTPTLQTSISSRLATLLDGSSNSFELANNGGTMSAAVAGSGLTITGIGLVVPAPLIMAANLASNVSRGAGNGATPSAVTGTSSMGTATSLRIGDNNASNRPINGYVAQIRVYPYSASDTELTYRSGGNF